MRPSPETSHVPLIERLIAIEKGVKAALFLVSGVVILHLSHASDLERTLVGWLDAVHIDPHGHLVDRLLQTLTALPDKRLHEFGCGAFLYMGIYLIEGIGLWYRQTWAAWLSVVGGAGLIPVEVYHLVRHPSIGVLAILISNLLVVGYLIHLIHRERPTRAHEAVR